MKVCKPFFIFITAILAALIFPCHAQSGYKCLPCGSACDAKTYTSPGTCPHYNMKLVSAGSIKFKAIQPAQMCSYIENNPNAVLLDVRTRKEFEGRSVPEYGTFKNAINIPLQELAEKLPSLAHLKEKEIIVYCSHSQRSPQACYLLTANGFTNITNMDGGLSKLKDKTCLK